MANILVIYQSNSGRTESMAKLVVQGAKRLDHHQIRLKSIEQATEEDITWAHALAVGTPTNLGAVSWKMKKFWDEISPRLWGKIDGKIATVFSSSAGYGGGAEIACLNMLSILINYGFLVFGVTDFADRRFSPHYGAISAGAPDGQAEQEACLKLGQRLAEWAAVYVDQSQEHHPMLKK